MDRRSPGRRERQARPQTASFIAEPARLRTVRSVTRRTGTNRPERPRPALAQQTALRVLLALVLLPFWFLILRGTETPNVDDEAANIIANSGTGWRLENTYMAARAAVDERGPGHPKAYRSGEPRNDGLRILAVGDSYTYGYGLPSRADAWPSLLEEELRTRGIDATVAAYAEPGASLFSYSDWFDNLENCEPADTCNPERFDAVIVGFYANDFHPRQGDTITARTDTPPGPPSRIQTSPYEEYAGEAARNITTRAGNVPVYWMPLTGVGSNPQSRNTPVNWDPDRWWGLLKDSGMIRTATEHAEAAVAKLDAAALMANPGEYHPSRALQLAYARDAAELFTGTKTAAARTTTDDVVLETTPRARTTVNGGEITLTYESQPNWFCNELTDLGPAIENMAPLLIAPGPALDGAACRDGRTVLTIGGEEHTLPAEPCMENGAPHLRVQFRPGVRATLRVTTTAGTTMSRVVLDQDGNRKTLPAEPIGQETRIQLPETVGLLVSSGGSCTDTDRSAVNVTVKLTR